MKTPWLGKAGLRSSFTPEESRAIYDSMIVTMVNWFRRDKTSPNVMIVLRPTPLGLEQLATMEIVATPQLTEL
jgi:hypothetical protein